MIRHATSCWNELGIHQGRAVGVSLSPTGVAESTMLSNFLTHWEPSAIYSSPLQRAKETAEILMCRTNWNIREISIEDRLNDWDIPQWEGKTIAEIKQQYPLEYIQFQINPHQFTLQGAETLFDVRERAMQAFEDLAASHAGLVVMLTHAAVIRAITLTLLGAPLANYRRIAVDPCSLTLVIFQDKPKIKAINWTPKLQLLLGKAKEILDGI